MTNSSPAPASPASPASPDVLVTALHRALTNLQSNPYPPLRNPHPGTKRASVAIIIRVRPAYTPLTAPSDPQDSLVHLQSQDAISSSVSSSAASLSSSPPPHTLDAFFSQPWVRAGDPDVLFIKRTGRAGDRWSGHVALPGGHRDAGDASDLAAAVRETREEVGLHLDFGPDSVNGGNCIAAGNLPERVVTTTWGRTALMVLCPYVFVLTDDGRLRPQPAEVAAAHWVPLRALLSPDLRTSEYVDAASRMARRRGGLARALLRLLVGRMVFAAVRLVPSESVYAASAEAFLSDAPPQPLLMWGLTLGILADLLDLLPPYTAVSLWRYPTFTPPDLRFLIWLFTLGVRRRAAAGLEARRKTAALPSPGPDGASSPPGNRREPNQTAVDTTVRAVAVTEAEPSRLADALKDGQAAGAEQNEASVDRLLSGYYDRMNLAIAAFGVYRVAMGCGIAYQVFRIWQQRRGG